MPALGPQPLTRHAGAEKQSPSAPREMSVVAVRTGRHWRLRLLGVIAVLAWRGGSSDRSFMQLFHTVFRELTSIGGKKCEENIGSQKGNTAALVLQARSPIPVPCQ